MELDPSVRDLVRELNALPGLHTFSSCGGHADAHIGQAPEGEFYVNFSVDESDEGWRALERVARSCDAHGEWVDLAIWYEAEVNFELRGRRPLTADALAASLRLG